MKSKKDMILLLGVVVVIALGALMIFQTSNAECTSIAGYELYRGKIDVIGTWYVQGKDNQSVSFNGSHEYDSENYLAQGTYSIKKSIVTLTDVYNDKTKFYVVKDELSAYKLMQIGPAFMTTLTRNKPALLQKNDSVNDDLSSLYASSIDQTLQAHIWDGIVQNGKKVYSLAFKDGEMTVSTGENENSRVAYRLTSCVGESDSFSCIIFLEDKKCSLKIDVLPSEAQYVYKLKIKDENSSILYSAQWVGDPITYASY